MFCNRTSRVWSFFAKKKVFWWWCFFFFVYWAPVMRKTHDSFLRMALDPMECQWRIASRVLIVTFDFVHLRWLFVRFLLFISWFLEKTHHHDPRWGVKPLQTSNNWQQVACTTAVLVFDAQTQIVFQKPSRKAKLISDESALWVAMIMISSHHPLSVSTQNTPDKQPRLSRSGFN